MIEKNSLGEEGRRSVKRRVKGGEGEGSAEETSGFRLKRSIALYTILYSFLFIKNKPEGVS